MPLVAKETQAERLERRYLVMLLLGGMVCLVFVGRLYILQVSQGEQHQALSQANFVDLVRAVALRGMIFDRTGSLLADNRPSFNVYFTPAYCRGDFFEITLSRMTEYLGLNIDELDLMRESYEKSRGLERWVPVLVRRDISWNELAALEQNLDRLEGVDVRPETRRAYPRGRLAAHMLGYVGEIDAQELEQRATEGLRRGDMVGKFGLERFWERKLRGQDGQVRVVVDSRRQRVPEAVAQRVLSALPEVPASVPGNNLVLSLDSRLQALAEERFPGREGAVVAIEPGNGFILALLSRPDFDPNLLSAGISARTWRELSTDPERPLTNRATQQHYSPGSTFKPFTALATLGSGAMEAGDRVTCTGALRFGGRPFRCWRPSGHGTVDLHRAMVQSCDVFFYTAGIRAGQEALAATGASFGFGERLEIDFALEVPGIMPSLEWYRRNTNTGFLPGFVLSNAIGQGDVNVTPLQLASAYAAIANGGTLYRPQVVLREETPAGETVESHAPQIIRKIPLDGEHLRLVREGLIGVVNEPGGTAYWRRPAKVNFRVAGKTGTVQVVAQGDERGKDLPYDFRDHALFAAWAPAEDPRILVVVVNEHGGHGSSGAAPLAMELIAYYLEHLSEGEQ